MGKIQISSSEQTFNWGEFRVLEGRLKTEDLETEDLETEDRRHLGWKIQVVSY